MQYTYRNLPCTVGPWCVTGSDSVRHGAGVLEWCYDQDDAFQRRAIMADYSQFSNLKVERFSSETPSPNQSELNLGDTVILASDVGKTVAYNHMTVKQVNADGTVNLFRPYVATTDFKYTGKNPGDEQVITYIGTETLDNVDPKKLSLVAKCSKTIR